MDYRSTSHSLRELPLEENTPELEAQTLSSLTTHGQAIQVTVGLTTNTPTTVDQDIAHATNTPSADALYGPEITTSYGHYMTIDDGAGHSIPVPFSNHYHYGGGDDESDDDDYLPDYDDNSDSAEDDSEEVTRQTPSSQHSHNTQMTAHDELEFQNRVYGYNHSEGSTNLNLIQICTICGQINTSDGTRTNNDHAPGSCTAPTMAVVQAEDQYDDVLMEDAEFLTLIDDDDYNESGDKSEKSDDADEADFMCTICSRRIANICFTPCSHFFCTSCALGIWWSTVGNQHHWPTSIPCPLCRGDVEDVIDEGGVVVDLLWWVLLISPRAQERALAEDVTMIIGAHAVALVTNL
ncbi:uncharacterized protein LAJ45_03670 [Morchella importuna]|uniref:uncharacterized protein n=1 Tax=Morchella importuna TaxID=1174673 RepID=UPI001E8CDE1F|nr:uncharacterized protein LAJ45_03670 [Morchella importuna]KAH8152244.1 hypothetical protein LAJ45_03670 [Morchella importuna]